MTLLAKQFLFSQLIARFIWELADKGYGVTLGESWRPPETAKLYAQEGRGISDSLHCLRLAQDLNLFKETRLLSSLEEYWPAGLIWESYKTAAYTTVWGGRFERPDADHFSILHQGVE